MSIEYTVLVEPYAERHYLKKFRKKHGHVFDVVWKAEILLFRKFDLLLERSMAETISHHEEIRVCKTEFRVSGKESRKSSGNRCIVLVDSERRIARVLLVYHKSHVSKGSNETAAWKHIVSKEFPELQKYLG